MLNSLKPSDFNQVINRKGGRKAPFFWSLRLSAG